MLKKVFKLKGKKRTVRMKKTLKELFSSYTIPSTYSNFINGRLSQSNIVLRGKSCITFPTELFHIKCLFDIEEFAVYDLFNFYKSSLNLIKAKDPHFIANEPTRLNFFYRIRSSVKIFRLHTLKFWKKSFSTEHKANLFFKSVANFSTLSYIWFFEFNLAIFLVKLNFSESIKQAHYLINNQVCMVNNSLVFQRWLLINPGDLIQLPVSKFLINWLITALLIKLNGVKKYTKFMEKLFFKKRLGGLKHFKKKKALNLVWSKSKSFKFIEIDLKTFSAFLLPYTNKSVYFKLVLTLWLNYWNFRVTLWKYRT